MSFEISEIKARLSLVSVMTGDGIVFSRVKAGQVRCLCPFHQEKTPSCYVDERTEKFKCFGCGEHGDVIDYVGKSRGVDSHAAMVICAQRAGLEPMADGSRLPPLISRPVATFEAKKLEPIPGLEFDEWSEGVEFLAGNPAVQSAVAQWRGYSPVTMERLAVVGKIGSVRLNSWLQKQDRVGGLRRVAFPVEAMLDGKVVQVAYHVRLKPASGEKRASWRFVPSGVGSWPYLLGNVEYAKFLIICEGQWDAIAFYDALDVPYQWLWDNHVAIVGIRGSQNWRLFVEHYLLSGLTPEDLATARKKDAASLKPGLRALVICDADTAGEGWTTPSGDEPCFVEILQAVCSRVYVREPAAGMGKDLNDVWKLIAEQKTEKGKL